MAEDGAAKCQNCGFTLQATGFELIFAAFPLDFDVVHNVITGATRFAGCPQCHAFNESVERFYTLAFAAAELLLVRPPANVADAEVNDLLGDVIARLPEGWIVQVVRDVAEFRETAGLTALAPIRLETLAEIIGTAPAQGPPPLSARGPRDRHYHAALALTGRPGVLVFTQLPAGLTEQDARSSLDEARRFQLAISFLEHFGETPLEGFDPAAAVARHFVPACFEDERVLETIAMAADHETGSGNRAVIDAALGAAAGERRSPRRRELAEELVAGIRQGVKLHDDPTMWRKLVDAEDVLRAILAGRPRLEDEAAFTEMATIAAALGHYEEVLRRYQDRLRLGRIDDPAAVVDVALAVAAEHRSDDSVIIKVLADLADSARLQDAMSLLPELLRRLEHERRILAVPVLIVLAKRLTHEGEPRRALALLDETEEEFPWEAFGVHAAATGRSSLLDQRGAALRALFEPEEALIAYDQALSLLEGQHHGDDVRAIQLNRARAMRDAGFLPQAISVFRELAGGLEGRERFDTLFGLALALQRNGQWREAQTVLDEANELALAEPFDDQIARFMHARLANARALGRQEETNWLDAVHLSPFVSARQRLLTLGVGGAAGLRVTGPNSELAATTLNLARNLNLPTLAANDPELALTWADSALLAGDSDLARETVEAALAGLRQPVLGMHAAAVAAGIAIDEARWDDARHCVDQAAAYMTELVGVATAGSTAVTLADTLSDFRNLGSRLVDAPEGGDNDRTLSAVADLGSSLQLSMQLAREQLPAGGDPRAPAGRPLQVLQWLDGGETQLVLLTLADEAGLTVHRGRAVRTELVRGLGTRIAGRLNRSPALDPTDILKKVTPFRSFQDGLAAALTELPIDPAAPLTVVPSAPMTGIPFHAALPEFDVAFCPSLAVALALAHRASTLARKADAVGEVRCWCHGDGQPLIAALTAGGEALRVLCADRGVPYEVAAETMATRAGVTQLVNTSMWLKLSCHGVTDPTLARFALVLSDGEHAPPSLAEVLDRPEHGTRYLFDWSEVADTQSGCRAVLSSACTSGSVGATAGGEQTGLARAFLMSGVLAFVAPLWPVAAGPGQVLVNDLLGRCMTDPGLPLATQLSRSRHALKDVLPPRVTDAFVLHGYAGPVNPTTPEQQ